MRLGRQSNMWTIGNRVIRAGYRCVTVSIEGKKCRLPMETCVRAARARCRGSRDKETFNCKPCGDDVVAGETGCGGTADL